MRHQTYVLLCTETILSNHPVVHTSQIKLRHPSSKKSLTRCTLALLFGLTSTLTAWPSERRLLYDFCVNPSRKTTFSSCQRRGLNHWPLDYKAPTPQGLTWKHITMIDKIIFKSAFRSTDLKNTSDKFREIVNLNACLRNLSIFIFP